MGKKVQTKTTKPYIFNKVNKSSHSLNPGINKLIELFFVACYSLQIDTRLNEPKTSFILLLLFCIVHVQ